MAQRLVLKCYEDKVQLQDLQNFVSRAKEINLGWRQEVSVELVGGLILLGLPIPEKTPVTVNGRRVVRRKKTKKEEAAEKQIEQHKKDVKEGKETPAHVPPVNAEKKRRVKCPVCNWRKDVVGGKIKKHQSQGVTCEGSGQPVPKKGKK